jgi:hypothetical protein
MGRKPYGFLYIDRAGLLYIALYTTVYSYGIAVASLQQDKLIASVYFAFLPIRMCDLAYFSSSYYTASMASSASVELLQCSLMSKSGEKPSAGTLYRFLIPLAR